MSRTVIIGAGIVGTSIAFYLSQHQPGHTIHLVDVSPELFASASGFAGGFLAKDWFPSALADLGALSFEEHKNIAESDQGASQWSYCSSTAITLSNLHRSRDRADIWFRHGSSRAEAARGPFSTGAAPEWLQIKDGDKMEIISGHDTVAQVDPLRLCKYLLKKCLESGIHLHYPARATAIKTGPHNEVSGVLLRDSMSGAITSLSCNNIIISAGAWSAGVFSTLFTESDITLPVLSLAGHSVVLRTPHWSPSYNEKNCHAVFMAARPGYSPEIFSRNDGQIYVGGLNSAAEPLPILALDSVKQKSNAAIETLLATTSKILKQSKGEFEVVREGLCFRPITDTGLPLIGRVADHHLGRGICTRPGVEGGVYVATGHGPWGISLSLGTGRVLAEIIQGRTTSANISGLGLESVCTQSNCPAVSM